MYESSPNKKKYVYMKTEYHSFKKKDYLFWKISTDRFRVEQIIVRPQYLEPMPEAPTLEEEEVEPNNPNNNLPPRKMSLSSILEPPTSGLKRLWSRRRSSVNANAAQLTLSHYLTKEVLPNLDNYRMSVGGAGEYFNVLFEVEE